MTTEDARLQQIIDLIARTGRVVVSQDVYDLLRSHCGQGLGLSALQSVRVLVCECLPPGTIMAVGEDG